MVQASVGYHCPDCVAAHGQRNVVRPGKASGPVVTRVLIAVNVVAYVAVVFAAGGGSLWQLPGTELVDDLVLIGAAPGRAEGFALFAYPGLGVAEGEWWRLVTGGFLHAGILHLGMNMWVLWMLGNMLEPVLGRVRFAAVYAATLLAGSMGVMLVDPQSATVGASGAIFGLMGLAVTLQRSRGVDPWQSGLGGLILVNLLITFGVPSISVGGHVGGLVGGLVVGQVLATIEQRTDRVAPAVTSCLALSAAFVAVALWAAGQWRDPVLDFLSFW